MTDKQIPTIAGQSFKDLKKTNAYDAEYWSARDLQSLLGYGQWRRFEDAVKRAITSCEQSGNDPDYHFAGAGKMIELGKGGVREVEDYQRFSCYLSARHKIRKHEMTDDNEFPLAVQTLCLGATFHGSDPLKTNAVLKAKSHDITFRTA